MQTILEDNHPVFEACRTGDYDVVEKILTEGGSVYAESEYNPAIFGTAACHGHKKILELMLRHGLDITRSHNRFGSSVAEFAIKRDPVEWLEYLLSLGVSVDHLTDTGHGLAELAADGGKTKCLEILIHKGAKLEDRSKTGGTPFFGSSSPLHDAFDAIYWEIGRKSHKNSLYR